jgi:hypothetical protein
MSIRPSVSIAFSLLATMAALVAGSTACEFVPATNPFDPGAPPDQQVPASVRGVVVLVDVEAGTDLAADLGLIRVGLVDAAGRPVQRDGVVIDEALVIDGASSGAFSLLNLVPGRVRLVIRSNTENSRFSIPTLGQLTLSPGEDIDVGTITLTAGGNGEGTIAGTVNLEGGNGAGRTVSLFKRNGQRQVPLLSTTTDAGGGFLFEGLFAGDYALSATLEGFTPDYRTGIAFNGAAGFAATFNGADALALFPVTAVLLPQLPRDDTDGAFYTRGTTVPLAVLAFGGVTGMRLAAAGCAAADPACSNVSFDGAFVPYSAAAEVTLPDVEGRVGIVAQFERSSGDFVFTSPTFLATVIRDVTAPVVDRVFVDGGSRPLVVDAANVTVDIEAQDASGVAAIGQVVTAADASEPTAAEVTFEPVSTAPGAMRVRRVVGLPAVDGSYTVWTFVRDRAGNDSVPVALGVRRDGTPADSLPIVVDDVAPLEGRSVLVTVSFDDSTAVNLPAELQVAVGNLPADLISGRQPFDVDASYPLTTTARDGETLLVQARLFDDVGNVVEVRTTTLVALRGTLAGIADVEQLGTARERAGTTVEARAIDGSLLASTTTDTAGAWRLPGLREGRVTVSARRAGHRSFSTDVAFLEADETSTVDALLPLLRGTLVGRFRRADLDTADGRHGDISVNARLVSQSRQALGRLTVTSADGDWVLDQVPATLVGESWEVSAAAQAYSGAVVDNLAVGDNSITVANQSAVDATVAEAVLLQPISGDFVLCSTLDAATDCRALRFTNLSSVRIHLLDDDGVTRVRAAADSLPAEATLALTTYDADNELEVALPDRQGSIGVFLDLERDGVREVLGPVDLFRDTVSPQSPVVVIARGTAARRDGFTNEGLVRATVSLAVDDADDAARESPLVRAPTFFADGEPAAPLSAGVALCSDGVACTVLFPSLAGVVQERIHDLWSFACDAAGNCSAAAGHARIVYDTTPPSALHGLAFSPTGDRLIETGPDAFRLGRPAFSVAVAVGEATTGRDVDVTDLDGNPVADADAFALSFVGAIDADEASDLPVDGDGDGTVFVAGLPLLAGEGDYEIFAVFVDAAGNATAVEPNPFKFTVTLDETPPSARLVVADGTVITRAISVATRLEDLSESGTVKLVSNAADCNVDVGYVASGAAPATFTLANADGSQLVVACLRDLVDNAAIATDFVTLDRVAPTGSVELDGGAAFSADRSLVAAFSNVSADVARLKVVLRRGTAAITNCALDAGYVAFTASAALSIGAAEPSGEFVVDACFEDAAGNKSTVVATDGATDAIFFDTTAPSATLLINDGAAFTTSSEVRVTISAVDADQPDLVFSSMRFANTTPIFSGAAESFSQTKAGLVIASPTVEGTKTVCVEVTDALARTTTACDDITLDLTPPAGTLTVSAFATTSPFNVVLRSSDLTIASAAVAEGLDCATATFTSLARNVDSTLPITLADTASEGSRTIVACFKDAAGQVARVERTVTFDPTNPALAQAVAPADGAIVRSRRPTFTWATVSGAVSFTLLVRSGSTTVLTQANLTGLSFTPVADLPEGSLDWIVVATKASGRSSTQTFVGAPRVILDVTAPPAAVGITIAIDAGRRLVTSPSPCAVVNPCVNDNTPRLSFTAGTDAIDSALTHIVEIADTVDPTFGSPVFTLARSNGNAFDVGVPLADGTYAVRVRSIDDAGNSATSALAQFVVDRTGPDAPSLLPVKNPVSSALAGSIVVGWTPEGPSGAVAYRFQMTTEARTFASPIVDLFLDGVLNTSRNVKGELETGAHVVHQVRVAAIDALGNQSPFSVTSFANDTTAPCGNGKTVRIFGSDVANDFSNSAAVVTEVSCGSNPADAFDGPFRMQIGCDGVAAGKPITGFAFVNSCVLLGGDGPKTVQAIVFDEAGNPTTAFSDTITLDRAGPTAPVLVIAEAITSDPTFEIALEEVSVDPGNNLLRHEFIDGVEVVSFDDPRAVIADVVLPVVVPLILTQERVYNVRVRGVDRAGNSSAEALVRVVFDSTPPTPPEIADNDTPRIINANTFTFFLDRDAQDLHFDHYELSRNGAAFAEVPGTGAFTVGVTDNSTTVLRLRAVDIAGNIGAADSITVIEDSQNPRPVALAPLPTSMLGGMPISPTARNFSGPAIFGNATVDVFLDPAASSDPTDHDVNFDHYEVRSSHPSFAGFVPICLTATRLCETVVVTDNGTTVVAADIAITDNGRVVGFRVPLVPGQDNTIALRSVDGAGNLSLESVVTTHDASQQLVTSDPAIESSPVVFGDTIAYVNARAGVAFKEIKLQQAGADNLFGTDDDSIFTQALTVSSADVVRGNFSAVRTFDITGGFMVNTEALGSSSETDLRLRCQHPDCRLQAGSPGGNAPFAGLLEVTDAGTISTGAGAEHLDDGAVQLSDAEASISGDALVWRRQTSVTGSEVLVREVGGNDRFDKDDEVANVSGLVPCLAGAGGTPGGICNDFAPVVSGRHIAFLRCDGGALECPRINNVGKDFRLVVVTADASTGFVRAVAGAGVATGLATVMTQAGPIDAVGLGLFAPDHEGRSACRTTVSWAAPPAAGGGVLAISIGPDRAFTTSDRPVRISRNEAVNDTVRSFSLHDDALFVDDFVAPSGEVVFGGQDGCLTTTDDNLAVQLPERTESASVHDGVVVGVRFDPSIELVRFEFGATRPLWQRIEGVQVRGRVTVAADLDRANVVFGSGGGAYDRANRSMRRRTDVNDIELETSGVRDDLWARVPVNGSGGGGVCANDAACGAGFVCVASQCRPATTVQAFNNVDEDFFDPRSDGVLVLSPADRPYVVQDGRDASTRRLGFDGDVLAWQSRSANLFAATLRFTGTDHVFNGTDLVCDARTSADGFAQLRASGRRALITECAGALCSPFTDTTSFIIANQAGACTSTSMGLGRLTGFDGTRLAAVVGSTPAVVEVRQTGRPTVRWPTVGTPRETVELNGQRVAFIDERSGLRRVVVGDVFDGSTRTIGFGGENVTNMRLEGDHLVWMEPSVASDSVHDVYSAHFGPMPLLASNERNPAPTRLRCPSDDTFEENDSRLTATALGSGGVKNGMICASDVDLYAVPVSLKVGQTTCDVVIELSLVHADGDLQIDLLSPTDTVIGSSTGVTDVERITAANQSAVGTYLVRVRGSGIAEGAYDVGASVTCR